MALLTPPDDPDAFTRHARRWADAAWVRGWHAHALDVLDHAIRLDPDNFKLYRKRGVFHLLCPDATVRDEEQGFADLRRACELSGWRDDLVRWVLDVLTRSGDALRAKEVLRDLAERGHGPTGDDSGESAGAWTPLAAGGRQVTIPSTRQPLRSTSCVSLALWPRSLFWSHSPASRPPRTRRRPTRCRPF